MKKVLILILAAMCCGGCEVNNASVSKTTSRSRSYEIELMARDLSAVEIEGHIYLIFHGYNKGGIIHAEHCPCKRGK